MECDVNWRRKASALWPEVSYEIRPLKVWAYLELMSCWEDGAPLPADGEERTGTRALRSGPLLKVARSVLPEHVRGLQGLHLSRDGQPIPCSVEDVCDEAMTIPLAVEMISTLVEISELAPDAEKN